ncbi:hypothetical protein BpHYR1_018593 [Brachionus plicatilis]|uniref:Uncharacterized protein n=1 Tax=Brachionus plicatilis TaxID=10195 RepID=A0A3M7PN72_BRAPC|nr:hypothetical protein BpHYR1_018593 [Brachionus plicatilis]
MKSLDCIPLHPYIPNINFGPSLDLMGFTIVCFNALTHQPKSFPTSRVGLHVTINPKTLAAVDTVPSQMNNVHTNTGQENVSS